MDKLTRLPGATQILAWSNSHPLQAIFSVCLGLVVLAATLGLWTDSSFLQSAAADFVGGMTAALIVFGLAEVAFGFTERRKREKESVHVAMALLSWELYTNCHEVRRIAAELRRGDVDPSDRLLRA